MVKSCPNVVKACLPCDDEPVENLSAEATDAPDFLGINHFLGDPILGDSWQRRGCLDWCFSTISQEAADQCALEQAQLCTWDGAGGGGNGGHWIDRTGTPRLIFYSSVQTCPICATSIYQLPFGAVLSVISQSDADQRAASLCSLRAARLSACPTLPKPCLTGEDPFDYTISITGGNQPWTFELTSGFLDGLGFDNGNLFGFPAISGSFPFTVTATDESGAMVVMNLTLVVLEITTTNPMPDASVGAAYSQTLTQSGGTAPISWQLTEGILPPGLTLNETTGIISGTPTTDPSPPVDNKYIFTISMQDEAS